MKSLTKAALTLATALPASGALARTVKGPAVAVEQAQPAEVEPRSEDDPKPEAKLARRRYEANLLAPVPVDLLGGMFVLKGDLYKERRDWDDADANDATPGDLRNPNTAGVGAIFLPHAKEGMPHLFLLAERYGYMSVKDDARPMTEIIAGVDVADTDLPFPVKFSATDTAESRIALRFRNFPGFQRWLPILGHKIERANGFNVDLLLPTYALAGWQTRERDWKVYAGFRWIGREYPFKVDDTAGWAEGHTSMRLVGVRRELTRPLYVALEVGHQKEELAYLDETGETIGGHETAWAPWARLALETWIRNP